MPARLTECPVSGGGAAAEEWILCRRRRRRRHLGRRYRSRRRTPPVQCRTRRRRRITSVSSSGRQKRVRTCSSPSLSVISVFFHTTIVFLSVSFAVAKNRLFRLLTLHRIVQLRAHADAGFLHTSKERRPVHIAVNPRCCG